MSKGSGLVILIISVVLVGLALVATAIGRGTGGIPGIPTVPPEPTVAPITGHLLWVATTETQTVTASDFELGASSTTNHIAIPSWPGQDNRYVAFARPFDQGPFGVIKPVDSPFNVESSWQEADPRTLVIDGVTYLVVVSRSVKFKTAVAGVNYEAH